MTETPRLTDDELATFALGFERLRGAGIDLQDEGREMESMVVELRDRRASEVDLVSRLSSWAKSNDLERAAQKMPTFLNPHTIAVWMGLKLVEYESKAGAQ